MNGLSPKEESKSRRKLRMIGQGCEPAGLVFLTRCSKILGQLLINGLKKFMRLFENNIKQLDSKQEDEKQKQGIYNMQQSNVEKRKRLKINFQDYECPDNIIEEKYEQIIKKKRQIVKQERPVRAFTFNQNDFEVDDDQNEDQSESIGTFIRNIGKKKVKQDDCIYYDQGISEVIRNQNPQDQKYFVELYNKIYHDYALILVEERQKQQEKIMKEKANNHPNYNYTQYLREINYQYFPENTFTDTRKKLSNFKRSKKERGDKKPIKKRIPTANQTPQIYNVEKVLEILDKQSEQFIEEKIIKLEEIRRKEEEALRLQQQQMQRQRKEQEQRLWQQNIRRQEYMRQRQKNLVDNAQKQQPINQKDNKQQKSDLEAVEEQKQAIQNQSVEEHSFGPAKNQQSQPLFEFKQTKSINNIQQYQQANPQTPPQEKQPEGQIKNNFSSPSVSPAIQQISSKLIINKEDNPYLRSSPAKRITMEDLIKADNRATPFSHLIPPTPSTNNIFTQNPSVPSIFGPFSMGNNVSFNHSPQGNMSAYQSPSNSPLLSQTIQPAPCFIGRATTGTAPLIQFTPSSPNVNAGPGSIFSAPNYEQANPQNRMIGGYTSQQNNTSMFNPNPNTAKMFESNVFMNQPPQQRSLFGEVSTSPQVRDHTPRTRTKRPVRIS